MLKFLYIGCFLSVAVIIGLALALKVWFLAVVAMVWLYVISGKISELFWGG